MSILVVDAGTSGVRSAIVRPDATIAHVEFREVLPSSPQPNFVEFDATAMADAVLETAAAALAAGGPVEAVGIANQRASSIVWDRKTGRPVGPGVGWQDLRTVGMCLMLGAQSIRVAPNASATKVAFLLSLVERERWPDLAFGTVDTWIAWTLSQGALHVTDASNAGVTGLMHGDGSGWSPRLLEALDIPASVMPAIVDSSGVLGEATALAGRPPIAGLVGDQQGSLVGQGCVRPGLAKITFGTGGMLDVCVGPRPAFDVRGGGGCFPIAAWQLAGEITWGVEAVMLAAGTNVEWLRDDLGIIATAAESDAVAAACADTGDVWYVPALVGLGTPAWDFGARGTFVGITRGSGRPELVRAVLEGVAHRGADLVESAEADAGLSIGRLRVDGGMTANGTFLQALADAAARPIEVSPVLEATTLGAAFLAGLAVGTWGGLDDIAATWKPSVVVEPQKKTDRDRWRAALQRSRGWLADLSALDF
ncbi:MAG TPA: FGGY-family carbohydrate kinase [Acidimicrobiales bacterium]|nr:FGGY-family carbohydrate kinase [Acidimicrobiales bacterium]